MKTLIRIKVKDSDISFAKKQIEKFKNTDNGNWRYPKIEAWRGIISEMLTSTWLESHYHVLKKAKSIGKSDNCDEIILYR